MTINDFIDSMIKSNGNNGIIQVSKIKKSFPDVSTEDIYTHLLKLYYTNHLEIRYLSVCPRCANDIDNYETLGQIPKTIICQHCGREDLDASNIFVYFIKTNLQ